MFSLIITIISIALVAALAIATIYYGGSAFTRGTADANASALMSIGQQVQGAAVLFANDNAGALPGSVTALVTGNYLNSSPSISSGALSDVFTSNDMTVTGVNTNVCSSSKIAAPGACASGTFTYPIQ